MERLADRFDWGPTIEAELCDGCRTCADFCHKGVFEERDGKVWVVGKIELRTGLLALRDALPAGRDLLPQPRGPEALAGADEGAAAGRHGRLSGRPDAGG